MFTPISAPTLFRELVRPRTGQNGMFIDRMVNSTMSSLIKMESQVDECITLVETRFRELAR